MVYIKQFDILVDKINKNTRKRKINELLIKDKACFVERH